MLFIIYLYIIILYLVRSHVFVYVLCLLLVPFMLEDVHHGMKFVEMKPSGMMPWMEAMESWVVKLQLAPWECSDF